MYYFYKYNPSIITVSLESIGFNHKEMFSPQIIKSRTSLSSRVHFLPPQLPLCNGVGTSEQ